MLMPFSTIFQVYHDGQFVGGHWSTVCLNDFNLINTINNFTTI